ncbi:hypothetical protein V6Z11_A02G121400 [Gossypium hirsutum]
MCSFHNPDSQSIGLMKLFWSLIIFEIHTYTVMIVIVIVNMKVMTILEMKILKTTNKNRSFNVKSLKLVKRSKT